MQRLFSISTPTESTRTDASGHADVVFTVANTVNVPMAGMAKLVPLGATRPEWLTLAGTEEREFPAGAIHQFAVAVNVPADAPAGRYPFRLDIVNTRKASEDHAESPIVTVDVPARAAAAAKKSSSWIAIAALALLAVLGVAGYLMFRPAEQPAPAPTPVVDTAPVTNDTIATTATTATSTQPPPPTPPAEMFLSDLEATIRREPHGGLVRDKTYWNKPLAIAGHPYDKGLFMHAREEGTGMVEYVVPPGMHAFRATIGLTEPCPVSSVRFQVLVNGKEQFASDVIRDAEQQELPPIAVNEGDVLTLATDNGGDGNNCDHSTWARARFVP